MDYSVQNTFRPPSKAESNENNSFVIDIPHVQQHHDWDCGIACVLMVLNDEERSIFLRKQSDICREEGFGKSVWTIDLAYLLKRFNVSYAYCTLTLGVNPDYASESFYKDKNFTADELRVKRRFIQAASYGIMVQNRRISFSNIINHLSRGNPAIVLVNGNLLLCETCPSVFRIMNVSGKYIRSRLNGSVPYQGHYITLCGFDSENSKIFYRNPGRSSKICQISYDIFENARHSYGTDDDIIFIYR